MFSRGGLTLTVTAELFTKNRARLVQAFREKFPELKSNVIILEGGKEKGRYNTDANDNPFRQESYFFWAFGVHEADCYAAIDVDSGRSILFPPKCGADYSIWCGKVLDEAFFKDKYKVDHVFFHENTVIVDNVSIQFKPQQLLLLRAENTDSGNVLEPANFPGIEQ